MGKILTALLNYERASIIPDEKLAELIDVRDA